MKLHKFLIIILSITILSVLYVYQQTKIIQMAYQEQERLVFLEKQLDENNKLKYNINRQMSLVSISGLWQQGDFEWPHRKQLLSLSTIQQAPKSSNQIERTSSIFSSLFGLKSQAEATSVKPR